MDGVAVALAVWLALIAGVTQVQRMSAQASEDAALARARYQVTAALSSGS